MVLPPGARERRFFVDTSAFLALVDEDDDFHTEAIRILQLLTVQRARQFTTNVVVIEAHALILSTQGIRSGQAFLRSVAAGGTTTVRSRASDEVRAKQVIYQYDDKDFSLTDAISFAVRERLGITRAFTFDRHFAQYGFTVLTPDVR